MNTAKPSDTGAIAAAGPETPPPRLRIRDIRRYRVSDSFSGILIGLMVVFSPWAFGTTQPASIWIMNSAGYTLGALLAVKWYIRRFKDYRPGRWGGEPSPALVTLTRALAALTVAILAYCLISALNARATWQPEGARFDYHAAITWLPHSYDSSSTWQAFWKYLALALSFWALRDWLLGHSADEARVQRHPQFLTQPATATWLPQRLCWLLWLLSLNGALLAGEGIAQRISGTNKLLWVMPTRLNRAAVAQFGPYAYRANGAQYLNLVWPAALGFWWAQHRAARRRHAPNPRSVGWPHNALLPCVLVMAAGPVISTSRGGAIVAVAMLVAAAVILMLALRRRHPITSFAMVLFLGAAFALGDYVGGDLLMERMKSFSPDLTSREGIFEIGRNMARDFPLFGVGPGALDSVFQLYWPAAPESSVAQLHNDWLETRVTFGWVGSGLIGLAFVSVLGRGFIPGGIRGKWPFALLIGLALAGCLAHARYDFPLQIYSILFLFLVLCAILSTLSLRAESPQVEG